MIDQYGRKIDYLRISVTDRCNLRCVYCMPKSGIQSLPHNEIMTFEEVIRVAKVASGIGIRKIKVTGGEPLLRKNLIFLIRKLREIPGIDQVTMTTNGVLFAMYGEQLVSAGLGGVNFSLDSLDAGTFLQITGIDAFSKVLSAIKLSCQLGLKTKINCVPIQEINSSALIDLAGMARAYPVHVRFIELMPIGLGAKFTPIENQYVLKMLTQQFGKPQRVFGGLGNGPARYYNFSGFQGSIGFISAITEEFCENCNRIRLTAEGKLKLCLHYKEEVDLKTLLREGITDEKLQETLQDLIFQKPRHHNFHDEANGTTDGRKMVQIGG